MAKHEGSATRAEAVHERLRADILSGRLPPGQRLKFQEVCDRYTTSVGAAREALTRLVGERLVQNQPNHGYMVTPLSHTDLADLTQARVEIESLALRMSVTSGDRAWEAQAVAAHHFLERTPFTDPGDPHRPTDEWAGAHTAFHFALIAGCPNRRLLQMARSLREEAVLYQLWSVSLQHEPSRDQAAEHRGLLQATLDRDADRAVQLLRDHLLHTARILEQLEPEALQSAQA